MNITKILFSPTGGTRKAVDFVFKGISTSAEDIREINLLNKKMDHSTIEVDSDSLVLIGMPSYAGRAPETAMKRLSHIKGNGAKCVLIVAYGNREYEDTLVEMYDGAVSCGFLPIAAVSAVTEHSIDREMAKGRPDNRDEQVLAHFGKEILHAYEQGEILENVPGNRPYKDSPEGSNCPRPDYRCVKCGKCREYCPVGAIGEYLKGDPKKCISCMGCISVCRPGARLLDKEEVHRIHGYLQSVCKTRKEPELFR